VHDLQVGIFAFAAAALHAAFMLLPGVLSCSLHCF
jgi:hypothetical protein